MVKLSTKSGLEQVKFIVTDIKSGKSIIISLADLYGYEGEVSGVLISYENDNIPDEFRGKPISFNSGYGFLGENKDFLVSPYAAQEER